VFLEVQDTDNNTQFYAKKQYLKPLFARYYSIFYGICNRNRKAV